MGAKKKTLWVLLTVGGIILLLFLANFYVKHKVRQALDQRLQPSAYHDLSVNIFSNNFSIENFDMEEGRFAVKAEKIRAGGLSYYKLLFKDKLELDELELISPKVTIFPKDSTAKQEDQKKRDVLINRFLVKDGSVAKRSRDSTAASFYTHIPGAEVKDIKSGMKLSQLQSYRVELDTLYLKMNPEHYIDLGNLTAEDGQVELSDFKIRSFFPRQEFDRRIPYEKDWIKLDVKNVSLDSLRLDQRNDTLYLKNSQMTVRDGYLNIYRNKLVKDDPSIKPLYSKMLREAPLYLNMEKILVENSEILYEEKVQAEDGPGQLRLAGINAEVDDLHNLRELSSQPKITANADFMRGTPVNLEWTFSVFNPQDKFHISGHFGRLEGEALDPFIVPTMNARARGTIQDVYFNFYGNDDFLQGDFRMNYDEFKIELLTKKKEKKKGFLSSLANLFVDNEQEPDEGDGQNVRVSRTKNRSFWNFIWKGLRAGLKDAVGQL